MEPEPRPEAPLGRLFSELTREAQSLFRLELELAKAELTENAARAARGASSLSVGAVVAVAGALAVAGAACAGAASLLALWMPFRVAVWLGPLLVGLVLGLAGYAMVKDSLGRLRPRHWIPRETAQTLRENTEWLKERVRT
jgi:hypothetical protein